MSGIYIHIPYCRKKCLYCDFYTGGLRIADWRGYTDSIINELEIRKDELKETPKTLYLGGGTPSLIPESDFNRLIKSLNKNLDLSNIREFTIEVNPEDVTEDKIEIWKQGGVNRVSIGVQSFNYQELSTVGRTHDSMQAENAVLRLQREFKNVSVDLMFGLPGQTPDSYRQSLEKVISIRPTHLSSYSLMLEEGTALTMLVDRKDILLPDESSWNEMQRITDEKLQEVGYERYEISNYCLKGFESQHNSSYWNGEPYLGLGCGAHSYDGNSIRRWNPNDIKGYIKFYGRKEKIEKNNNFFEEEILEEKELIEEMILTRLRTKGGISLAQFKSKFGEKEADKLKIKARPFLETGLLKETADGLSMTDKGYPISDLIIRELF